MINLNSHTSTIEKAKEEVGGKVYLVITETIVNKRSVPYDQYEAASDAKVASIQAEKVSIDSKAAIVSDITK